MIMLTFIEWKKKIGLFVFHKHLVDLIDLVSN